MGRWARFRAWLESPQATAALAAALSIWEGWLFIGPWFGIEKEDRWGYASLVFVGTMIAVWSTYFRQASAIRSLEESHKPKLCLVFDREGSRFNPQLFDSLNTNGTLRKFRIGVINSGESVTDVAVKVTRIHPQLATVFPAQELQQTHKEEGTSRFTVNKSDEPIVFVEVIRQELYERDGSSSGQLNNVRWVKHYKKGETRRMDFVFASGLRDLMSPYASPAERYDEQYLVWLTIDGEGAEPARKFVLRRNNKGHYDFSEAFA